MNPRSKILSNLLRPYVSIDLPESEFFTKPYLKERASSKQFLKNVSYKVHMGDLMRVSKTCAYHENMEYCPVLLEIIPPRIKDYYRGSYLLQVYNKQAKVVYEKVLKYDLASWNIFHDYFVFKMDRKEEGHEWIHIVHLSQECKVMKVKDFAPDASYIYMGVNQQLFFYGNQDFIKIVDIKKDFGAATELEVTPTETEILTYEIGAPCKLHGMFENSYSKNDTYILCAIETEDNQFDYTRLYIWERDQLSTTQPQFYQYREVVQRAVHGDRIVKHSMVIMSNEFQFGLALRASGKIDFYWNFTLVNSPDDQYFDDIQTNFDSLFLKCSITNEVCQVKIKWDQRVGIEVADRYEYEEEHWNKILYNKIRNYARLQKAIALVHTTFFVAYGKIVSTYNIISKLWEDHFIYDEEVMDILRNQKSNNVSDGYTVGVLLKSGKIKIIDSKIEGNAEVWYQSDQADLTVSGQLDRVVSDWRDISSHYIFTKQASGSSYLYCLQNQLVSDLTPNVDLAGSCYMLKYLSHDPTKDFLILNKEQNKMKIYQSQNSTRVGQCSVFLSEEYTVNDMWKITGTPHTAVMTSKTDFIFIFDESNIYVANVVKKTIEVHENFNIGDLQIIDSKYMYSLSNECTKTERSAGFFFMNLENFVDPEAEVHLMKLKKAIVGKNILIDYYKEDERIAYMNDYSEIKIVPVLHRNVINFIGMKKCLQYVCYCRKVDKFIALDTQNMLTSWNICTGKVLSQYRLKVPIVTPNFEIYRTDAYDCSYSGDWYSPRVLLYDKNTVVPDIDDKAYFGDRLYTSLKNNTAYTSIEQKQFKTFKILEILNDTEVKEHFTFVHPHYGFGQYQRIYFSDDLTLMLERLQNQRVFLYQREETSTPGVVKWKIIRRLVQFPMDLSECTYYNYLFSPNLKYYLDYDRSKSTFVIKRSIDQSLYAEIGKIMQTSDDTEYNDRQRKVIASKFRWLNNSMISIVDNEGIEKIMDVHQGFKIINEGTTPMYDIQSIQKEFEGGKGIHYYYRLTGLDVGDSAERLRRKYQKFFSGYYLQNIRDPTKLYDYLFELDYSIDRVQADGENAKVAIDMSFTYVHWRMAEMLSDPNKKAVRIKKLNDSEIQLLLLNIFPLGKTVLHLCNKNLKIIRQLFDRVNTYNAAFDKKTKSQRFEIPFTQDFNGVSPIHQCFQTKNYKAADIFLENLKNLPLDSHARAIYDVLPEMVEHQLPSFGAYLDSRFMQSEVLEGKRRGAIKYKEDLDYAISTSYLWVDAEQVEKDLLIPSPLDAEIKIEFLDMQNLHSYNDPTSEEFFKALSNADIEMFQYKSIMALIDYKWPLAREFTVKMLFLPFVIYLAAFIVYSNVFNGQHAYDNDHWKNTDIALSVILYFFSCYFLINESRQLFTSGIDYLKSVWNYSDMLPPLLIIVLVSLHLNQQYNDDFVNTTFMHTIHSVASLLMWAKLLYFLRIFKHTGHLIRILTEVIYDMKIFLLILFIVYLGFGEAFLRLSESSGDDSKFIKNYAYAFVYAFRLSIGDTATDTFDTTIQPVTLWIIWVCSAVLTNVVMLNLLIAIISESFGRIMENSLKANYQERARIIHENSYLIPNFRKKRMDDLGKLLIRAYEIADDDNEEVIEKQVTSLQDSITSSVTQIMDHQKTLEEKLDQLLNKN